MAAPEWVFLDLDNTLWDFDANAEEALGELFHRHHLHIKTSYSVHHFVDLYKTVNAEYWKRYEKGEIAKDYLRTARFTDTFLRMGIPESAHPENIWQEYLEICPVMTRMVTGAHLLLEVCSRYARVALITNGFASTQAIKIRESGIEQYIQFMVTSEDAGIAKPEKGIFDLALKRAGVKAESTVYIGDTFDTDIRGGISAGLPVMWFNPGSAEPHSNLFEHELYLGQFQSLVQVLAYMGEKWAWV